MTSTSLVSVILRVVFFISIHLTGYSQVSTFLVEVYDAEKHPALDSLQRGLSTQRIMKNSRLRVKAGDIQIERVFRYAGKHEAKHRKYGLHRWYRVTFDETCIDSVAIRRALSRDGRIEHAAVPYANATVMPDDSLFYKQWNFHNTGQSHGTAGADISLINAMRIEKGKPQVVISIHDSGLDFNHKDLTKKLWTNPGEIPDNEIDDDDNGFIDDVHGYNFQASSNNLQDTDGHGTHVAGVIASQANAHGVTGIAGGNTDDSGVRIMVCRLDDDAPGLRIIRPVESIIYAADNGAIISQNSWSTFGYSFEVRLAIEYFANEAKSEMMDGGLVVFSAGNDGSTAHRYESDNPNVMTVGNTDHHDVLSQSSNFGSWLAICAPGTDIFSNHLQGSWKLLSGTSMAAPHVSGVAGLVVSKFGHADYTPDSAIVRIRAAADNIDAANPGKNGALGSGRLNAFRSLVDNDSIGPMQIDSIYVDKIRSQDVTLKWVAPRDSLFSAFKYEVKYSGGNTDSVNNVHVRIPTAGDTIKVVIDKLKPDTEYSISITCYDYFGNASTETPPIAVTTTGKPAISFSSFQSAHTVHRDSSYVTSFEIINTGQGELDWSLSSVHPDSLIMADAELKAINYWNYYEVHEAAKQLGATASELIPPVHEADIEGMHIIVLDDQIRIMDSLELETVARWVRRGGSLVMMADSPGELQQANRFGKMFGVEVRAYPENRTFAVEPLRNSHPLLDDVSKVNVRDCGTYLVLENHGFLSNLHPVFFDIEGNIHIVAGTFGKGKIVFAANRFLQSHGISDVDNLRFAKNVIRWLGKNATLRFDKQTGSLPSGQSEIVNMSFNNNLENPFNGKLHINSNDIDHPFTEMKFSVDFKGAPVVQLQDIFIADTTYAGYAVSGKLLIRNTGTDTLYASVHIDHPDFYVVNENIVIPHRQADTLTVYFAPELPGDHNATLSIFSMGKEMASLPLSGFAIDPPAAIVFPLDTLNVYVPHGSTVRKNIYIHNLNGNSPLDFSLSVKRTGGSAGELLPVLFSDKTIALSNPGLYNGTVSRIDWGTNIFSSTYSLDDLNDIDLLMLDFQLSDLSDEKIADIRQWVQNGGRVLIQLDQIASNEKVFKLLSGTSFKSIGKYAPAYHDTVAISALHFITEGTRDFRLRNCETYFSVRDSLHVLISDQFNNTLLSWETLGQGKIVIASGRLLSNDNVEFQNTRLVTQCFNWLLHEKAYWFTPGETGKRILPGSVMPIPVTFHNISGEDRQGRIDFRTNDPAKPLVSVNFKMLTNPGVTDENEAPQIINIPESVSINENPTVGQSILPCKAFDKDGDAIRWFTNASFVKVNESGVVQVGDSAYFDFETKQAITIEIFATDGIDTVSSHLDFSVLNVNEKPRLTLARTHSMLEDEQYEIAVVVTDPEDDAVVLAFDVLPNTIFTQTPVQWEGSTLKFSPDLNQFGSVNFTVRSSDGILSDSLKCILDILPVNDPPQLSELQDQQIVTGDDALVLQFTATDVDNDNLLISIHADDESIFSGESFVVQKQDADIAIDRTLILKNNGVTQVTVTVADLDVATENSFTLEVSTITDIFLETDRKFAVYPNPASSELKVVHYSGIEIRTLEFINAMGEIVKICQDFSEPATVVFVGDLLPGIYILQFTTLQNKVQQVKLCIHRDL